ncbi:MAG: tetratricopeptide repeat protein [Bacteroidales bacterium]|jgi:tetratricopeptide (TPR) repeat protein|nr:tetratricopeptide repeat protein [Bacteroidales bacterium]
MKKYTILLVILFSISSIANAQNRKRNSAKVNLDKGKLTKAKELIDIAVAHEKTIQDAKTWLYYGQIYAQLGASTDEATASLDADALNKALEGYKKSASLDEKNSLFLELSANVLQLANTFYANGIKSFESEAFDKAIDCFDRASASNALIDVVDTMTIYATALSASNGGINDVAIEKYEQLIEMAYINPVIYSELANVYKQEENFEKAEEVLTAGRVKFPENNGILIAEINILLGQGRFDEVITKLKRSIELEPENASLYLALGDSYKEVKNNEEAVIYYQQALDINPDYFLALYNLGVVYYSRAFDLNMKANNLPFDKTEEYKIVMAEANVYFLKSLPYFEHAYTIDPDDSDVVKALRQIYTSTKQLEKLKELNNN